MITVFLLGATDRFNFGDLLYPIILENIIKKIDTNNQINIKNSGIVKSDFSAQGAIPTISVRSVYKECEKIDHPIFILIVGGEVVGSRWGRIVSFIDKDFKKTYDQNKKILRHFEYIINDIIAKKNVGGKGDLPFQISKKYLKNITGVIYNSVGGIRNFKLLPYKRKIVRSLQESVYCSFRDKGTFNLFKPHVRQSLLVPDTAILVSEIFPKKKLSKDYLNFKNYVFFQISKREADYWGITFIISKIKKLITGGHNVVLCPIGTALGHEDHIPLMAIYNQLHSCHASINFIKNPKIVQIISLIANAELYIGSSLHGIITSMSYSVPYLSLRNNSKITSYLETWGQESLLEILTKKNWDERITEALNINPNLIKAKTIKQISKVSYSLETIINVILSYDT